MTYRAKNVARASPAGLIPSVRGVLGFKRRSETAWQHPEEEMAYQAPRLISIGDVADRVRGAFMGFFDQITGSPCTRNQFD